MWMGPWVSCILNLLGWWVVIPYLPFICFYQIEGYLMVVFFIFRLDLQFEQLIPWISIYSIPLYSFLANKHALGVLNILIYQVLCVAGTILAASSIAPFLKLLENIHQWLVRSAMREKVFDGVRTDHGRLAKSFAFFFMQGTYPTLCYHYLMSCFLHSDKRWPVQPVVP